MWQCVSIKVIVSLWVSLKSLKLTLSFCFLNQVPDHLTSEPDVFNVVVMQHPFNQGLLMAGNTSRQHQFQIGKPFITHQMLFNKRPDTLLDHLQELLRGRPRQRFCGDRCQEPAGACRVVEFMNRGSVVQVFQPGTQFIQSGRRELLTQRLPENALADIGSTPLITQQIAQSRDLLYAASPFEIAGVGSGSKNTGDTPLPAQSGVCHSRQVIMDLDTGSVEQGFQK